MADAGLMGEVLSSLQTELLATLRGVEVRSETANLQDNGEFSQWDLSNRWTVKITFNLVKCQSSLKLVVRDNVDKPSNHFSLFNDSFCLCFVRCRHT